MLKLEATDRTAFVYGTQVISYREVVENINKFRSILNIEKGDRVIIFSENSPFWVYSLFAIWEKGGVAVPIDFMSSKEDLEYYISDCKPKVILTSTERLPIVNQLSNKPQVIEINRLSYDFTPDNMDFTEKLKDDVAVILYTSGTTGNPKGVMLTFDNLLSNIESVEKVGIASCEDKTIAILPFHHSYPLVVSLLIPLQLQATIVFLEKLTPDDILKKFQDYKITILVGVPRLYNLFHKRIFDRINSNFIAKSLFKLSKSLNYQPISRFIFKKVHQQFGGSVKYFVSGGSKLDVEVAKDLWSLGFKIIEGYGLTETSPIVSFNPPDKIKLGSVGKVIEGVEVKIKDDEILVKGRNVFKGYYNKPKETDEAFENGYFKTGDLGFFDEDGYLYITGRKKEIIVLPNGKNINPEDIENYITKNFPIVKEIAVIERDRQLFAVIYPDYDYIKKEKIVNIYETIKWNVIDKYNLSTVSYKRLNGFTIVNTELPKTRLGKIRRFMLREFLQKQQEKRDVKEPEDEIYQTIKNYLQNYTKITPYPDSHIEIDLGLDSLGKIEFLTFLETAFGVNLSEDFLVENQTVEKIYTFIKDRISRIESSDIDWKKILSQKVELQICDRCLSIYIKPILKIIFKLYNGLSVKGVENIPNNPVIFASNHQSFLDGFLIAASLPTDVLIKTYFLAEETYFNSDFRKFIAKKSGILIVNINKNLRDSLLKSASVLKKGKNLVIFPEGARTRDGNLLEFKKSFAILSRELNIPVVPVVIKGAFESFPINSKFPKPRKITVEFLEVVYPQEKSYDDIVREVYNKIDSKLKLAGVKTHV
ncbi:MAG: AMP-binding protein [Hydrogenothermaceae bacterium]